jgi:uncharacterized membrane protein
MFERVWIKRITLVLGAIGVLLLTTGLAMAQSGSTYDLSWWTVNGGGGKIGGGGYTLVGTAGQPDAGAALTGGGYRLTGGFWPGGSAAQHNVYLPLVVRE